MHLTRKVRAFLDFHKFSDDLNVPKISCWGFRKSYPLHQAMKEENWPVVVGLLAFGANPNLTLGEVMLSSEP